MPFDPLPDSLQADLERFARHGGAVGLDLGCGDSDLASRLSRPGLSFWGVDRLGRSLGGRATLAGDVRALPVGEGRCQMLIAANLVRHLVAGDPAGGFLKCWADTLATGGVLYVLEDVPDLTVPARRHYHDLQCLLAVLAGKGRGPLLDREIFTDLVAERWPGPPCQWGQLSNQRRPDTAAVLDMLDRATGPVGGEPARLRKAIAKEGLEYGDYWWVRLDRREE